MQGKAVFERHKYAESQDEPHLTSGAAFGVRHGSDVYTPMRDVSLPQTELLSQQAALGEM